MLHASTSKMKRVTGIAIVLSLAISMLAHGTPKSAYIWIRLDDGLHYTTYSFASGDKGRTAVHAFLIDPRKYRMGVAVAKDEEEGSTARTLAEGEGALTAINGGFFTRSHRSIGLIVNDGKVIRTVHRTSWWSIFAIKDDGPFIIPPSMFRGAKRLKMALQAGPRLAVDGKIPRLKRGASTRSAIGITKDGNVVIAITSGKGITLDELAHRMSKSRWEGGLECPDAMALDGGASSQLYARVGNFELELKGLAKITNALVVLPK